VSEEPARDETRPGNGRPRERAPEARVKRRVWSPIWLIPISAAGVALYVALHAFVTRGPLITITFKSADGLSASQTEVRHKAVKLGTVEDISLAKDLATVVVHVRMNASAKPILTNQARFWVVRPRLSGADLARIESGLETLVSGAYIAVDPGRPGGKPATHFSGLDEPPGVRSDEPGQVFELQSERLGSLGVGAPVFYRDVAVGEVLKYDAGAGKGPVSIRIFVRAPFDALVHADSRFWNASGLSLDMGPTGLHLEFESLQAVLSGGLAFETRNVNDDAHAHVDGKVFEIYDNRALAQADLYSRVPCATYLASSVSGLAVGAPVQIRGVQIGVVTDERLVMDADGHVLARVGFDLQPERALDAGRDRSARDLATYLVSQGLRVELSSTNFVTGQKVLSLEYSGAGKHSELHREGDTLVLPGQGGGINDVTRSLSEVAAKLDRIPIDDIGKNIDRTLRSVNEAVQAPKLDNALHELTGTLVELRRLAHDVDAGMGPVLARLPGVANQVQDAAKHVDDALGESGYGKNSDFQRSVTRLVGQANDAARNIRLFVDYLDRHPEALIRGRSEEESR
jgi:paraquat-inducible protein B